MTRREKLLAGAIAMLVVAWVAWRGVAAYRDGVERRLADLQQLEADVMDARFDARRARAAMRRLEALQEQSLPANADVARSAYSAWLVEAVEGAGLELANVKFGGQRRVGDAATALTFTATASGPAEGVVRLLDAYYRLGAAHQIGNLQLTPASPDGTRWRVTLTTVALVVDGTTRETGVPDPVEGPGRLDRSTADEYARSVTERNVFAEYTPPPPPRPEPVVAERPQPPAPPEFDDATQAQLTGIVETGDRLQAWVRVRTTGQTLRLSAGDPIEVGSVRARVQAVLPREIVLESEGEVPRRVELGERLREG